MSVIIGLVGKAFAHEARIGFKNWVLGIDKVRGVKSVSKWVSRRILGRIGYPLWGAWHLDIETELI